MTPTELTVTLTVAKLKAWNTSRETNKLRADLILAKARAQVTRERVNAYIAPVFARFAFYADRHPERRKVERITDWEQIYLSKDDAQAAAFYAACDEEHKAHGWNIPAGNCPICMSESAEVDAENALLNHAIAHGILPECIKWSSLENRAKALDLMLAGAKP